MNYDTNRLSLMTFSFNGDILFKRITIAETLHLAEKCGVPHVDAMNVTSEKIPAYQQAMDETGVKVHCLIANISFFMAEDKIRTAISENLDAARQLGASLLMIVPYSLNDKSKARKMGKAAVHEKIVAGYKEAVAQAKDSSVTVCFETAPHAEFGISGNADCKLVLDAVPGLKLVLDTANMLAFGDETMSAYDLLKDYVVHVHLKDVQLAKRKGFGLFPECTADGRVMTCVPWGQGVIPIAALYKKMLADGYTGQFAIEYVPPQIKKRCLDDHIRHLQTYLKG